jgi:hypothetical protein
MCPKSENLSKIRQKKIDKYQLVESICSGKKTLLRLSRLPVHGFAVGPTCELVCTCTYNGIFEASELRPEDRSKFKIAFLMKHKGAQNVWSR